MAGKMGKAVLDVEGDFSGLQKEAAGQSDQIGTSMGTGIGKKLGAAAAVAGAVGIGVAVQQIGVAVGAASDLNEAINATGLVFGDAAAGMDEFFASSATNLGIAETAARQAATNVGALFTNLGFGAGEAATATQDLMTRAADLGSAFNTEPQQVVEALGAALRGETEPARKFGIMLDDASVKAKAVEMGLAGSTAEVDKNAKAQASIALIMEQSNAVAGDFANTSDGLANSQRILTAQLADLQATLGAALLPAIGEIVGALKDVMPALKPVIQVLGKQLGALLQKLVPVIEGLMPVIAELVAILGNNLLVIFEALAPPILALLAAIAPLITALGGLTGTILSALANALEPLLTALGPIVAILVDALVPVIDAIGPSFTVMGEALASSLPPLLPLVVALAELLAALMPLLPPLIELNSAALPILIPLLELVAKIIGATLTPIIKGLTAALEPVVGVFADVADSIADVPGKATVIITWFQALPGVLLSAVAGLPGMLLDLGYRAIRAFGDGAYIAWTAVATFVGDIPSMISSAVGNVLSLLYDKGNDVIDGLLNGIKGNWSDVTSWLGDVPDKVVNAVGNLGKVLYEAGRDLMRGFLDGIKSMASSLANAAKDVVGGAIDGVKGVLGIGSPSKVFRLIGLDTMEGLRIGLAKGGADVADELAAWGPALEAGVTSSLGPLVGNVPVGAAAPIDARLVLNAPVYGLEELDRWADQRDRQLMMALTVRGR
jgi:phage-related protein